jgi:hypothetical protein
LKSCLLIAFAVLMPVATIARAAPVTNWFAVNAQTGATSTKPLAGAATDSPVLGNGTNDSAAQVALYADISGSLNGCADIELANGQEVTLTGSATLSGIVGSIEQFRWGLFNEAVAPFDAASWRGYIASNSNGPSGGALRVKEAEVGTFAQTGSAVTLATAQDGSTFDDDTYQFSLSVSRFNEQVVVDASLTSSDNWSQVWSNVAVTSPSQVNYSFNRVGFLAGNGMHADQISFSDIDVTVASIDTLTLQVTTTGTHAGAVQIRNRQLLTSEIEFYEVLSPSGALNAGSWTTLNEQEGSDPPLEGWEEAAGNNSNLLSEYRLFSTTSIAPSNSLSLGSAFVVGGEEDLQFNIGLADGTLLRGIVEYIPGGLTGDYNDDNFVDAADYVVWRKNAGTKNSLPNDPIGGAIGAAQYENWRASLGSSGAGASASAAESAVPEPSAWILALVPVLGLAGSRGAKNGSDSR